MNSSGSAAAAWPSVQKVSCICRRPAHSRAGLLLDFLLFSIFFCFLVSDIISSSNAAHTDRDSILLCFDHLSVSDIDCNVSRCPADIPRPRVAHDRTAVLDRGTLSRDRDACLRVAPLNQTGTVKGDIRYLRPPDIGCLSYL